MEILDDALDRSKNWSKENFPDFRETYYIADRIEYDRFEPELSNTTEGGVEMEVVNNMGGGMTIKVNERWFFGDLKERHEGLENEKVEDEVGAYFVHELAEASLNAFGSPDAAIFPGALHEKAMKVENTYREQSGLDYRGEGKTATVIDEDNIRMINEEVSEGLFDRLKGYFKV